MMKYNIIIISVFFALAALASTTFAEPSIEAKFTDDRIMKYTTTYINFKFTGVNFRLPLKFVSNHDGTPSNDSLALWTFIDSNDDNNLQHIEELKQYKRNFCYDTTTGQVVAHLVAKKDQITIQPVLLATALTDKVTDNQLEAMKWDINCPVGINTDITPQLFTLQPHAYDASGTEFPFIPMITLAMPSLGFVSPLIDFTSASIKQDNSDPYSSTQIDISFTTNAVGIYSLGLINGPKPDPSNHNNGQWADLYCTSGSNKEFGRIAYSTDIILFPVKSTAESIHCKFLFSNSDNDIKINSERLTVQLAFGSMVLSRNLQYKPTPAAGSAQIGTDSSNNGRYYLLIESTPLDYTSTPLNNNSTIEFKFSSQFDLQSLVLDESAGSGTSFRSNVNCYDQDSDGDGFLATSFVDKSKHTITLKDILRQGNSEVLYCLFEFLGNPLRVQDQVDMASVEVRIDDKRLVSRFTNGFDIPIYVSTIGSFNRDHSEHIETTSADGKSLTITDIFAFADNYKESNMVMKNPLLNIAIYGAQLFNMEDYSKQITCSMTTPSTSSYQPLELKFDQEMLTWSAKLTALANVESYSVLIKCSRTMPIIRQFGYDVTPLSSLDVAIVNLIDQKRYVDVSSQTHPMKPRPQSATQPIPSDPLPVTVATGCISAEYILPTVDKAAIDLAISEFKVQADKHIATLKPGFTVKSLPVRQTTSPLPDGDYYLSCTAPIQYAQWANRNAHDLKSYYTSSIKVSDSNGDGVADDEQEFFTNTNNKALQRMSNAYYNTDYVTTTVEQCYEFTKDATATEDYPTFTMTEDELKNNLELTSITGQYLKVPIIRYNFNAKSKPYGYLNNNSQTSALITPSNQLGCGMSSTHFKINASPGTQVKWSDLTTPITSLCQIGEQCTYNVDCESDSCRGQVCVPIETYNPPFIAVSTSTNAMDKDYFNNAATISIILTISLIILSIAV